MTTRIYDTTVTEESGRRTHHLVVLDGSPLSRGDELQTVAALAYRQTDGTCLNVEIRRLQDGFSLGDRIRSLITATIPTCFEPEHFYYVHQPDTRFELYRATPVHASV